MNRLDLRAEDSVVEILGLGLDEVDLDCSVDGVGTSCGSSGMRNPSTLSLSPQSFVLLRLPLKILTKLVCRSGG